MNLDSILDRIIKTGDRADLKKWLEACSDNDLAANWIRLSCCDVQGFQELVDTAMKRRNMIVTFRP